MSGSPSPAEGRDARPAEDPGVARLMRPPTVTVEPDAHLASAAYLMKRSGDSALVVTDDDERRRPLAIITDADVTQAVADGRNLNDTRINHLQLPRPVTVGPQTPVPEAAERMLELGLQHLPVVEDGRLVGLVDLASVCRALLEGQRTPPPHPDETAGKAAHWA